MMIYIAHAVPESAACVHI